MCFFSVVSFGGSFDGGFLAFFFFFPRRYNFSFSSKIRSDIRMFPNEGSKGSDEGMFASHPNIPFSFSF